MKSTLALIAMAAAATANASVSDAVLANALAFAKDARKVIDANNGRRQLAEEEETQYMKGKCVKGQATDIASMKSAGIDLVIPATGYCMASDDSSILLTCDGTTLNYQTDDKPGCKQVTKNTTKLDMSAGLGPCVVGEVEGVHLDMYTKADCSDAPGTLIVAKDSCMNGVLKVGCDADKVTLTGYPADSKCAGDADATNSFTSGDDKCHKTPSDPEAEGFKKECPKGSMNGASSKMMFDEACCMDCTEENTKMDSCADVQAIVSKGGCYADCFGAMKKDLKALWLASHLDEETMKPLCTEEEAIAAEKAAEASLSAANTATIGLASIAILAVVTAVAL